MAFPGSRIRTAARAEHRRRGHRPLARCVPKRRFHRRREHRVPQRGVSARIRRPEAEEGEVPRRIATRSGRADRRLRLRQQPPARPGRGRPIAHEDARLLLPGDAAAHQNRKAAARPKLSRRADRPLQSEPLHPRCPSPRESRRTPGHRLHRRQRAEAHQRPLRAHARRRPAARVRGKDARRGRGGRALPLRWRRVRRARKRPERGRLRAGGEAAGSVIRPRWRRRRAFRVLRVELVRAPDRRQRHARSGRCRNVRAKERPLGEVPREESAREAGRGCGAVRRP